MVPIRVFASTESIDAQPSLNTSSALNTDPMSGSYLLQMVIGLFIVLLCIIALAWFAKKMNRFRLITDDSLKIMGGLSMGSRERVVLLQVGEAQLLIGVAPGRINTLHVLEKSIETTGHKSDELSGQSFSSKLKAMMDASSNNKPGKKAE